MRKTNSTFLEGPILPSLLRFALPVLLALFLQALYGAVDLWAVGTFCDSSDVSAVATGSQTMLIVTGIITGLSMGIAILLGHRFGEKDYKRVANVIGTSIWIFALLGMILTLVMVIAAPAIAVLMHAPAEAFDKTVHYIRICGAGTLFIVGYNVMSNIFRGMGNSKAPLLFVTITCIVNIIGDIVLISVFNMGTAGAALATIAAQNVDAGQKERAKKSMWLGMATAVGLGGIMSYMSFFHGDMLSSIFIKDFAVIQASVQFLKATAIECFILSIAYCFTGYYNGLGKTSFVMAQGLCAIFLVRIPYAYYASRKPAPSLFEIGMSATLAAAFTLLICIVYYIHQCKREKQFEELIQ